MSVHDRWGGKRTGDGRRWEVRWRDRGTQRKRRFDSRVAADAWNATVTLRPGEGRVSVTVEEVHPAWMASKAGLTESTRHDYARMWRRFVQPRWGSVPVDAVRAGEVAAWVGELAARSPSQARRSLAVLSGVMGMAALNGEVAANPCSAVAWPTVRPAEVVPLTHAEVQRLAHAAAPHELVVWVMATLGLRFGEMAGLRVGDLDMDPARLSVSRSVTSVGGRLVEGLPKWGRTRIVPVPQWLATALDERQAGRPRGAVLLATLYTGVRGGHRHGSGCGVARRGAGRPARCSGRACRRPRGCMT